MTLIIFIALVMVLVYAMYGVSDRGLVRIIGVSSLLFFPAVAIGLLGPGGFHSQPMTESPMTAVLATLWCISGFTLSTGLLTAVIRTAQQFVQIHLKKLDDDGK